jgi:RND family efflux transporter MFP subunit
LANAQVQQAQAELKELQIRLEQSKIHSPMNAHVARRYVDVGALVNPSTPIVSLVNLSVMVTAANVPEREVSKLRPGNQAKVQVDAFRDRVFEGRVARISPVLDAATRSALVEVEIPNPDWGLKAEMFARVMLDLASTRPAVLIPREALVYRGTQPGVYIVQSNRPVFRNIETGLTEGDQVEVLANLEPGTSIVTRGATMLTEGDQIRVAGAAGKGSRGKTANGAPQAPAKDNSR